MTKNSPLSGFLGRILITSLAVIVVAYLLPGVSLSGVMSALLLALVLAVLNVFVKPLLIFLTLPFTIITLGLFLVVINALIIMLADKLVPGFSVGGFWWALLFSIILSLVVSVLEALVRDNNND
jgi:putative membrane protein